MKLRTKVAVCILGAALVMAAGGCSREREKAEPQAPLVGGLTFEQVRSVAVPDLQEAVGTVRAKNAAAIAARVTGVVTGIQVQEGSRVRKGQLLLTLEAAESSAQAAGATAAVEEASRGLDEAKARQRLAEATFGRYQKLYQEQAVTRQEFDNRQTEKEVADRGAERAAARLAQSREMARAAGAIAGYTKIAAPLAGVVTGKSVDRGVTVFPGMPLLTVEEEGNYRLEVSAPESLLGKIQVGQSVKVAVDGMGDAASGRVAEVVPTADPVSRTFTVKVEMQAKGLRSGVYGRAWFPLGERQGILVPKDAVVERGALTSVWVVDPQNLVRMRLVKTGKTVGDRTEILAGLANGERIVTGGMEKVVDGAKVQ